MYPEEKQLLSLLHGAVRRHYGKIGEIEHSLGREPGYFSKLARGERPLTTHGLFEILRALGEPINGFLRSLHDLDVLRWLDELPPGPSNNADEIAQLRKKSRELLANPHKQNPKLGEQIGSAKQLTRREPHTAARVAHTLACAADCPADLCDAVAVYVAARRVTSWLEPAVQALTIALPLSSRAAASIQSTLLLETSAVLAAHGEYEKGRLAAAEAAALAVRHEEYPGLGKALANQAIYDCIEGNYTRGVARMKHAMPHLAKTDVLTRSAACQAFSAGALSEGNISLAWEWADKAHAIIPREATYDQAALVHWRAAIANKEGDFPTAEGLYRRSRDLVRPLNIYDLALRSLELVRVLIELRRRREAVAEARQIIAITKPLRGHRLVEAATIKLSVAAHRSFREQSRQDVLRLITSTVRALQRARARR